MVNNRPALEVTMRVTTLASLSINRPIFEVPDASPLVWLSTAFSHQARKLQWFLLLRLKHEASFGCFIERILCKVSLKEEVHVVVAVSKLSYTHRGKQAASGTAALSTPTSHTPAPT